MENKDYKYVLQDTGNLYVGARFSYEELIHSEDIPFKLKAIIKRYIVSDMAMEDTLESHFYYMNADGFDFQTFKQLKTKVKVSILTEKKSTFGKTRKGYQDKIYSLEQFIQIPPSMKEKSGIMIQEIILSKFALMTFSL